MQPTWESQFREVLQKSDIEDTHLIAQGKEACGLGAKIKHVLGSILTFNKPNLDALYRKKGQEFLRERNVKFIHDYADTTHPELTEKVVNLLTKLAPDKHLITKEEITLAEALYALESLKGKNVQRSWITPEQIDSLEVSEQTVGLIHNLKELDILCRASQGQTHRFAHCVREVMGDREILEVTDRDLLEIRALFQAWVSVSPPPDALNFKTLLTLYKELTGRKTLNAGDCRRVHDILRIAQNQTMRVNTAQFIPEEYTALLEQYSKERSLERWDNGDFARIEKLTTLWTTYLPNEPLGELMNFTEIAYGIHGKELEQEKLRGLTPEVLSSLQKILEIKQQIRISPTELYKANRVFKGLVKLTGKPLHEIRPEDLGAVSQALKLHEENPDVSFKEFYKLHAQVNKVHLPEALEAYPGYKKLLNVLPERSPTVEEFITLCHRIAKNGWKIAKKDPSKNLKKETLEKGDWVAIKRHFERVEAYPVPPEAAAGYHKLVARFLNEEKVDAFLLATAVFPGHPNISAAFFGTGAAEKMDPLDLQGLLYRLKLLYDDTPPEEHPILDRALEKTFQKGSETDEWINAAQKEFEAIRGVKKIVPQKAVKLTAIDHALLEEAREKALARGVLEAGEVETLIRHQVSLDGEVNRKTLDELLLARENLKLLHQRFPPGFRNLMMRHLFLADHAVILGTKSLNNNHLYNMDLSLQGVTCARLMSADLNRQHPECQLSRELVDEVMLSHPPQTAEEVEMRLHALADLQTLYIEVAKTNKEKTLLPLLHVLIQRAGPQLIQEEFRGKRSDLAGMTDLFNGVLWKMKEIQKETDLPSEILISAALSTKLPEATTFWGKLTTFVWGADEPTLINRLDALRDALSTPEGKSTFNRSLLETYMQRACALAFSQEYLKPSDKDVVALFSSRLGAHLTNQDALLNRNVQSYVYHLAKVAIHFIDQGNSPDRVFQAIEESKIGRRDLQEISLLDAVDENEFATLEEELAQKLVRVVVVNRWNKVRDEIHQRPELILSKVLPSFLEAMATTDEERQKARHAGSNLQKVAKALEGMKLKERLIALTPTTPGEDPGEEVVLSLALTLLAEDPATAKEYYHNLRPQLTRMLQRQVKSAVDQLQSGQYVTDFSLDRPINDLMETIIEAHKKQKQIQSGKKVKLSKGEDFWINSAPKLNGRAFHVAQFALHHFPGVFNLEGQINRKIAKFLLNFVVDRYADPKTLAGIGEKEQVKKLLDPLVDVLSDATPILTKHHNAQRFINLITLLSDAVNSPKEIDTLKLKTEIIKTFGEVITEVDGYSDKLESALTSLNEIGLS